MNPIESKQTYQQYVDKQSPNSPILKNCFNAFWVGGLICTVGQIILNICKERGIDVETSGSITSIILIGISAFLTGLNLFNKIGKFAGAGSLVPITGFANSIVSPAMEYKSEGYVMGVGGKMFTVAGPVLVFGISASIMVGIVYLILMSHWGRFLTGHFLKGEILLKKLGEQTIKFDTPPTILDCASIVGPKESEGPLVKYFDQTLDDEFWGEKSWEKAESKIIKETVNAVISKSGIPTNQIDCAFAGDLLNQCISSSFGLRELNVPFLGVFGACSTFVESLTLGSICIESFANNVLCATSSHFCSAEKQFRFPLELGNQRPPTSQWTVTGSGAAILSKAGTGPYITHATMGKIVDLGIKDANNMGSAMAPAFADTLISHFQDTGRNPSYYDAIFSGDLGYIGKDIAVDILKSKGYNIRSNYNDCGVLIFDKESQDTHSGGSGCACCATVFSGYLFKQLKNKKLKRILLIATGALMNSTSSQQGESIPGIAHAVSIEI